MAGYGFCIAIALIALGTQAMRMIPMLAHGRFETPPWLKRLLAHVPAATLAALMIPGSVWLRGAGGYEVSWERIAALLVAGAVGLYTKSIVATIAVGLAALWFIQYLF